MSEQETPDSGETSPPEWFNFPVPEDVWNQIVELVKNVPDMSATEVVTPEKSLLGMGVDSLVRIEFRMECEDEFDVHLEDNEVEKCENLGQLASFVSWLLSKKESE